MYGKGIKWYVYCKKCYKIGSMFIVLILYNYVFVLLCVCLYYIVGINYF